MTDREDSQLDRKTDGLLEEGENEGLRREGKARIRQKEEQAENGNVSRRTDRQKERGNKEQKIQKSEHTNRSKQKIDR